MINFHSQNRKRCGLVPPIFWHSVLHNTSLPWKIRASLHHALLAFCIGSSRLSCDLPAGLKMCPKMLQFVSKGNFFCPFSVFILMDVCKGSSESLDSPRSLCSECQRSSLVEFFTAAKPFCSPWTGCVTTKRKNLVREMKGEGTCAASSFLSLACWPVSFKILVVDMVCLWRERCLFLPWCRGFGGFEHFQCGELTLACGRFRYIGLTFLRTRRRTSTGEVSLLRHVRLRL